MVELTNLGWNCDYVIKRGQARSRKKKYILSHRNLLIVYGAYLWYIYSMIFEFDPNKSKLNKEKHGIDFVEIQRLWDGVFKEVPATNIGEERWFVFGELDGNIWVALITKRENAVRIFSARRASKKERVKLYGQK